MLRATLRKNSLTLHVLKIIAAAAATGVAMAAFAAAPGLAVVARELLEAYEDRDRRAWLKRQQRIREAVGRLARRRLVRFEERGTETCIVITKNGASELRKFEFEAISILRPQRWDGRWRLVMFDIPERVRRGRQALRQKLRELGFHQLQKSVFVFPYECHDEIDFVTHFCGVARYTAYVECADLGLYEIQVRRHFELLLA